MQTFFQAQPMKNMYIWKLWYRQVGSSTDSQSGFIVLSQSQAQLEKQLAQAEQL